MFRAPSATAYTRRPICLASTTTVWCFAVSQNLRHLLDRAEHAAMAGDFASADELLRDAARAQEEELGPLHPDLANTLNNLAVVVEKTGRSSEAEALYRRAAAIAAAALPSDHPMVVASRQNLEDFCRARGLPVDAPAIGTPAPAVKQEDVVTSEPIPEVTELPEADHAASQITATAPIPPSVASPDSGAATTNPSQTPLPAEASGRASSSRGWLAAGLLVLAAAALLFLRPWSSPDVSKAVPAPAPAAQPPESVPPAVAAPPARPGPIGGAGPPKAAPRPDDRPVAVNKPPTAGADTVDTAQLCRTFSTSGGSWRCDPIGSSVTPGPLVLYTRIKSLRDTIVVHRWYRGETLRQSVSLTIRANATEGFRTYSRQTVTSGDWRVEVRSADGHVLHEQRFAVRWDTGLLCAKHRQRIRSRRVPLVLITTQAL